MGRFTGIADRDAIAAEMPWADRDLPRTMHGFIAATAARHGVRNAVTFQLTAGPTDAAETLTWTDLHAAVIQTANLFRALGIGETDVVAYVLPNCTETVLALLGGMVAGVAGPVNPMQSAEQIAAILRESGARVVVTLKAMPNTDVPQRVAAAVALAPAVHTVLEVDLARYLTPPKRWVVPLLRPENPVRHAARVLDFNAARAKHRRDALDFPDSAGDRIAAVFHTGGTTGHPKLARHRYAGMIYNGWLGQRMLFDETAVLICPLPLFHVFAAYPVLMSVIASGAHMVLPTPQGYRGEGVFDNFWKLTERHRVSFLITVPTAVAALLQRPVNADLSRLKFALCGSSPLPVALYRRFEEATGVVLFEGYGLTEATCLVSCNPPDGAKKIGSVGIPFPHSEVVILDTAADGSVAGIAAPGEVGEICVAAPGVVPADLTPAQLAQGRFLRTGDLGRLDAEGYLFITGRAKDLIIRGGHNIDPAIIEDALAAHPAVALAGAVGQPDVHAGELPCAYVELVAGATITGAELAAFAATHIAERAAVPRHVEVLAALPKTAVGKIFKPDLRRRAMMRVLDDTLQQAGLGATVVAVTEDRSRGLVARIARAGTADDAAISRTLDRFACAWEWDAAPDV